MRSGTDMMRNVEAAAALVRQAAGDGARFVATPETTHLMELKAGPLFAAAKPEAEDPGLAAFRALAEELGIWLLIGSLAVKVAEDKAANRSFLIAPDGRIAARYDKIHMFDVDLDGGESYRESKNYRPGDKAVVAETPWGGLGLTICYDLRFAHLYRRLAQAGARLIAVPAAFTRPTGEAHWKSLLRARAIETGAFVLAPAQGGVHENGRVTWGHSLIVDPWGRVLAEAPDDEPGIVAADLDLDEIERVRGRIPSLTHDRAFDGP
jgi:predicted amidohydrolase